MIADPEKLVFKNAGERWCFGIPDTHTVYKGQPEYEEYLKLNVGDILESRVGHADYNTATFDVELTVLDITQGEDVWTYLIQLTKFPNP